MENKSELKLDLKFWTGFTTGALIGGAAAAAGYIAANSLSGRADSRVLRLESSIQIGRELDEVFDAWSDFSRIPEFVPFVKKVNVSGNRSRWQVNVDGKDFEWQAQTTQFLRNEAIGWKSYTGPKHSGRITFSKVGDQTLVLITLNYAPPLGRMSRMLSPAADHLEGYLAQALRDFKEAIERRPAGTRAQNETRGTESKVAPQAAWRVEADRKTGTYGGNDVTGSTPQPSKSGKVDYTRPPEARYPFGNKRGGA